MELFNGLNKLLKYTQDTSTTHHTTVLTAFDRLDQLKIPHASCYRGLKMNGINMYIAYTAHLSQDPFLYSSQSADGLTVVKPLFRLLSDHKQTAQEFAWY